MIYPTGDSLILHSNIDLLMLMEEVYRYNLKDGHTLKITSATHRLKVARYRYKLCGHICSYPQLLCCICEPEDSQCSICSKR